jgi:plasmid stabilization system protein ParE
MPRYGFHPDAKAEYEKAIGYLIEHASLKVAAAFVDEVETAIKLVLAQPTMRRPVNETGVRRFLFRRFPYALYYLYKEKSGRIEIYAIMHLSRRPDYWRGRIE